MTTGLVKPNGLPTFQSGNPLAADMLFYGVDLGNGTMVDVAPGGPPLIAASSNPPTISTSYGSGIDWDNQNLVDGDGYYANVDNSVYQDAGSTIQNALNLAAAGPGAGFTFGCTFVELGPTTGVQGLIFGRPAYAAENAPYWNEAFTTTGSSSPEVDLVINNDGVADVIGQYDFGSYGTVVSLICTVQNTSDGSGIAKFFASSDGSPGVLVAEATVSADSTYGIGHDQENQIMFGSVYHVLTGVNWNSFNGPVFSGFIAGTAWTDAEAISWLSNPYELLSWAPLAAPSITSVTGDAGTIGNGASTNDPDPTVQVSLSGTGAQAGDTLQLFYDGTGTSTPLGISYTLTSTDINNGFATVQTGRLTNGTTYSLTAQLTDQAGNQSDASSTFTVIENTALPAVIWANGISGTWQTASDWTPSVVPGASNNVFILPSGTSTVTDSQSTTIDSVVTAANATLNITGGTFTITNGTGSDANAGTIEVEGGATLNILAGTLTNTGTLEAATGGTLDLAGTSVTNTNATVTVASGSTFNLENATLTGGNLADSGAVHVALDGTSTLSGVTISVGSTGETETVTGSLALDGNAFSSRPFESSTSASVALTTKNADDVIILEIVQNGTTVSSVSDTADLTWNLRAVAGTGPNTIYEYYAIAPNALSADAITVDLAGTASYVDLNAFGISGANTLSPFDTSVLATPVSSTGTVTTSNADDLVFASYRFASDASPSAGSSWTAINASGGYYLSEYQITSATQTGLVATASTTDENGGIVDAVQASTSSTATVTGALTVDAGSTLDLVNTTITGGVLTNAGTVDVTGDSTSALSGVSVSNATGTGTVTGSLALDGNAFSSRPFVSTSSAGVALTTKNADDVIILEIVQNGTTVSSVSDTADLTWNVRAVAGTGPYTIYEYYAIAPNALSADAITVDFAGTASYVDLNAFGISGANTSSPFDTSVPVTPATSTGTVTTSNADDLVFASYRFTSDATPSAGPSWTAINASGGYYLSEYQITSAPQTGLVATASTADENGGIVDSIVQANLPVTTATMAIGAGSTLDFSTSTITNGTLSNSGTLVVTGGGASTLDSMSVTSPGGTVGAITIDLGSTLDLEKTTIVADALINAGTVDVTGGNTSTLSGVSVTNTTGTEPVTGSFALDGNGFSSRPFVSTTSTSVALTTANADDVIILEIVQNGSTVSSVSDTADLTWNLRAVAGTGPNTIYEYYAIAPNALSADAITANFAGTASYVDLNAFGISGANTSSPFDTAVPVTSTNSTGALTTSNADDFVFAGYRFSSDATPGAGTSWTAINASGGYYLSEYQITSAPQTGLVATASTADENGGIVDAVVQESAPTTAGALTVAAGSTLDLNNTTITGGSLTNAGTVDQTGGTSALSGVAITNSETIEATSGTLTASGPVTNTGNLLANGGNLDFTGAVTGNGTATLNGANSILEFGAASAENTTFAGTDDILKLDNVSSFTGTVAGMAEGDGIDLTNFLFSNNPTVTGVTGTGAAGSTTNVTVHDGSLNATLELLNQYTNQFAVAPTAYSLVADNNTPNHGTTLQLATAHA